LQEDLADFVARHTVSERTCNVNLELVRPVEGADHRQIQHAPRFLRKSLPPPNRAPTVFGDQFLKGSVEVVCGLQRGLDEWRAENGLADFQASLERLLVHRVCSRCKVGMGHRSYTRRRASTVVRGTTV